MESSSLPVHAKFLCSATAGVVSTLVCYPLELLKNAMQVYGKLNKGRITPFNAVKMIVKENGILGLYEGWGASVLRQTLYTGTRMGLYYTWFDYITRNFGPPSLLVKCGLGIASGAAGGIAGLPPDVALTRLASDDMLPPHKRRNYKNDHDAMIRMYKEEGIPSFFLGFTPVVIRAIILNTSQILSYYQIQQALLRYRLMEDNTSTHVFCSLASALLTTYLVLPIDMAKTRIQSMQVINGKPEYRGVIHVLKRIVCKEGFFALWSGFTPLMARNGPQFLVILVAYEESARLYMKYILK